MTFDLNKRQYVDYKVYSVLKLKDKYGFKIKLIYDDKTEEIQQRGGFNSKKEANDNRNVIIAELYNKSFVVEPKIKTEKFLIDWLENEVKKTLSYNSYISYRNIVLNYMIPHFKNLYINNLNKGHIQSFYNSTAQKYKSIARLSKAVVKSSMQYASKINIISSNPALDVELPKCIKKKKSRELVINTEKTLSLEQIKILINESKDTPIYFHILFAVLMGMRRSEILGLKYSDIDFIHRKIKVQRQLGVDPNISKEECKKKTYTKQEIKVKTFSSKRELDIPDIVFEAILEERKKYEERRKRRINDKTNPFQDLNYICCSTYGKPRSKGFHMSYYKEILKSNNLPNIRFHDLRHTYSTLLVMNNYDLKAVSQLMGHATEIITVDRYTDMNSIIVDCLEELEPYIESVIDNTPKCTIKNYTNEIELDFLVEKLLN